jgi:hypothetical protein
VVGLERRGEDLVRIDPEASEELGVRAGHPGRRLAQPVAVGVLTDREKDLPDGAFDPRQVDRLVNGDATERPVDQSCREVIQLPVVTEGLGVVEPIIAGLGRRPCRDRVAAQRRPSPVGAP